MQRLMAGDGRVRTSLPPSHLASLSPHAVLKTVGTWVQPLTREPRNTLTPQRASLSPHGRLTGGTRVYAPSAGLLVSAGVSLWASPSCPIVSDQGDSGVAADWGV